MTAKLTGSLRAAPATVPALAALVLFVVWASDQAGYPLTHWAPGGLVLLALLAIALALVRLRPAELPRTVRIALAAMGAYTAFSFLSILWAAAPGDAWEGANRTLLYLLVFALFASWPQRGLSAALLLIAWTLALVVLAGVTLLHIDGAGVAELANLLPGGRLDHPTGYPNANAAQWLMAFWPALLLARSERLPWALRGLLAGGAVLLAEVALLSQSRGSLYATPAMAVLVLALIPRRIRTFALFVPVAAGVAAAAPAVLRVGDRLHGGDVTSANVHSAVAASFAAAVAVAVLVALAAAIEARASFSVPTRQRLRTAVGAVAVLALVAVVAGGLVAAGNPVDRIRHSWDSFRGGYAGGATGSRLASGLGSNRYDFYRVALDEFDAHPLAGIGADNFQQQYLLHGHSSETPRYPHSIELRTLAQTGVIGGLLALIGLGAALLAGWRAMRAADPLAAAVAAAALAGFGYWVVHGSVDWFWEFAGLGAPAFALLGLLCALSRPPAGAAESAIATTRSATAEGSSAAPARARGRVMPRLGLPLGALLALACALSLGAPWLSQLQLQSAARVWTKSRSAAYARLDDAASLNPLSDEAYLELGSIALRYGELDRADRAFAAALRRTPDDAYATLERGAIASQAGRRTAALALLARAVALDPRDGLARAALSIASQGQRVSVDELNRAILLKAQQLA
jgi:tetratricopeptide (TPR) repeat protein